MKRLRIILVDDHEVVRLGLRTLLERHTHFEIVDEAGSAEDGIKKALTHRPDVVVMDIRMPGQSGIEACRAITEQLPDCKVIMLTSYAEDELLFSAIAAGASGYVLKRIGSDDLIHALEAMGRGESLLDPSITGRVFEEVRRNELAKQAAAFNELTAQEMQVLSLVSEGLTNREIAARLFLGEGTVRNYVSNVLSKLGVANRAEAAAFAVEHSLKNFLPPKPSR